MLERGNSERRNYQNTYSNANKCTVDKNADDWLKMKTDIRDRTDQKYIDHKKKIRHDMMVDYKRT